MTDQTIAAHLADLERDSWRSLIRAADPRDAQAAGVDLTELGGALAMRARDGGMQMNLVFDAPADRTTLGAIVQHYKRANLAKFILAFEVTAAPERAERVANEVGLIKHRRGMIRLVRETQALPDAPTELEIGLARADEAVAAAAVMAMGFGGQLSMAPVLAAAVRSPQHRMVVARSAGAPVAAGIIYFDGDDGYLAGASTLPTHRALGAQGALISMRVAAAESAGIGRLGSHTGESVPGEPQHSERNMRRHGFRQVGRYDVYLPA